MNWFQKLFSKNQSQEETVIKFNLDLRPWDNADAENLKAFLRSDIGDHFIKHLKKHQIDITNWAIDSSSGNYKSLEYKACVAHGVKLALDNILNMSQSKKTEVKQELTQVEFTKFFNTRMGLFKT
jgi:hypothetical protein